MGGSSMMAKGGCAAFKKSGDESVRAIDTFRTCPGDNARNIAGYRFTDRIAPTIPTDGLVAEYLFNDNVLDTSGFGRHGVVNGTEQYADGYAGKAFQFNGATHIEIPNITLDSCTICALFKNTQSSGYCVQLNGKYVLTAASAIRWKDGHSIYNHPGSLEKILFRQPAIDNSWHFSALVSSGQSNWVGYGDTTCFSEIVDDVMGGYTNMGKSYIGSAGVYAGQYYYRPLVAWDNIRIYNRALSDDEIRALAGEISYKTRINI